MISKLVNEISKTDNALVRHSSFRFRNIALACPVVWAQHAGLGAQSLSAKFGEKLSEFFFQISRLKTCGRAVRKERC